MTSKTYSGFVYDVNDGEADIMLDVPLRDGAPDIERYTSEHDGEYPDRISLPAERWMQSGTRLEIVATRHPDDEPVLGLRDRG